MPLESTLPEDIVFTRAADKISKENLLGLIGDYDLGGVVAHIGLTGESLQLTIPGQPSYDLVPLRGLAFNVKGLNGFSVEFKKDAAGQVSELILNQPDGANSAKRKRP
jgi:hypothetical protein